MMRALTSLCSAWRRSASVRGGGGDQHRFHLALAHQSLERVRHGARKTVLLQVMPIGRLDRAAPGADAGIAAARLVGALLAGRRIVVDEDTLGLEVGILLVARIAQEQRLAAVADENDGIVGNLDFAHGASILS